MPIGIGIGVLVIIFWAQAGREIISNFRSELVKSIVVPILGSCRDYQRWFEGDTMKARHTIYLVNPCREQSLEFFGLHSTNELFKILSKWIISGALAGKSVME